MKKLKFLLLSIFTLSPLLMGCNIHPVLYSKDLPEYENMNEYLSPSREYSFDFVQEDVIDTIDISYYSGSISFGKADTYQTTLVESSRIEDEDFTMRAALIGRKLYVQCGAPGYHIDVNKTVDMGGLKSLRVKLSPNIKNIYVHSEYCNIYSYQLGFNLNLFEIHNLRENYMQLRLLNADNLNIYSENKASLHIQDSKIGKTYITGSYKRIKIEDYDSVAGPLHIINSNPDNAIMYFRDMNCPKVRLEGVDADMEFWGYDKEGASFNYQTTVQCLDFSISGNLRYKKVSDDLYIIGYQLAEKQYEMEIIFSKRFSFKGKTPN